MEDLIHEAQLHGVEFIYAIAPGVDICYSSEQDMTALKVSDGGNMNNTDRRREKVG